MPHVLSSRVNSPSARSWQRLARRVGKCSPKRAEESATVCPNRRRQFLALQFGKCSSQSKRGLESSVPRKRLSVARLGQAWCACAGLLCTGNSRLRVKGKQRGFGNPPFQDFGLLGAEPDMLSSGRIFVIKLKRNGKTPEVPRKVEKGLRHKNTSSYTG